jgi:hypothetical protein
MTTEYATMYGHEYTGRLLTGPKAGSLLHCWRMDNPAWTAADAITEGIKRRPMIDGTVRVYERRYYDERPALPEDDLCERYLWIPARKGKGGFLVLYIG